MLIQITNRCQEGCKHCMQNSLPDGPHMTEEVFKRAIAFGKFLKVKMWVISGGEPTEHPQFYHFCKLLNEALGKDGKAAFTVVSNGTWYRDSEKVEMVKKLSRLRNFAGMQVYTNKQWYKDYDFIMENKKGIESIEKIYIDTEPLYMQDLGRARMNKEAQEAVAENKYHMSCLNGHLLFAQLSPLRRLEGFAREGMMCKPLIDFKGNVHLSESWYCQSFGNIMTDLHMEIFKSLKDGQPCCKCALGKKYLESDREDIMKARYILGQ